MQECKGTAVVTVRENVKSDGGYLLDEFDDIGDAWCELFVCVWWRK